MSGDDRPRDARLGKSVPPCLADILPCFEFYLLGPYSWACIRLLSTSFFEYIRQLRPELDLVRIGGKYGFNIAQCVQIDETFTIVRMRIGHPSHSRLDRIDMMPPPPERPRLGDALEQRQVEVAMMATAPTPPPERPRLGDALEQRQVEMTMATAPRRMLELLKELQLWDMGSLALPEIASACRCLNTLVIIVQEERLLDMRSFHYVKNIDLVSPPGRAYVHLVQLPSSLRCLSLPFQRAVSADPITIQGLAGLRSLCIRSKGIIPSGAHVMSLLWLEHCRNLRHLSLSRLFGLKIGGHLLTAGCTLRSLLFEVPHSEGLLRAHPRQGQGSWAEPDAGQPNGVRIGGWLSHREQRKLLHGLRKLQLIGQSIPRIQGQLRPNLMPDLAHRLFIAAPALESVRLHSKTRHRPGHSLETLECMAGATSLVELSVSGQRELSNISALITCIRLRVLHIQHAFALMDLTPLAQCGVLQRLHLSHCNASDFTPLAQCTRLQTLRLSGCQQLTDLTPMAIHLPSLTHLCLRGCVAKS